MRFVLGSRLNSEILRERGIYDSTLVRPKRSGLYKSQRPKVDFRLINSSHVACGS